LSQKDKKKKAQQGKAGQSLQGFAEHHVSPSTADMINGDLIAEHAGHPSLISDISLFSESDPNGSYTGITRDGDERPVQDADDL